MMFVIRFVPRISGYYDSRDDEAHEKQSCYPHAKDNGKILDSGAVFEASPLAHPMAFEDRHPGEAIVTFGKRIKPPRAK